MTLFRLLLGPLLVLSALQFAHAEDDDYHPIQLQLGQDIFTLQPTSGLVVSLGDGRSEAFTFGPGVLGDGPSSPAEANAEWLALSAGKPVLAEAFHYRFRCDEPSRAPLPEKLRSLCGPAMIGKSGVFIVKSKREGREVGSHRDAPKKSNILGHEGSMTIIRKGLAYWEGALPDGPVAVLCQTPFYQCRQSRSLTSTTYYEIAIAIPAKRPPTNSEWLAFSTLVAKAARAL